MEAGARASLTMYATGISVWGRRMRHLMSLAAWGLMSPEAWGLLAGLTGLAGYVPYLRDAWRRASDPDPAAWLIWTVEYSILLAARAAQDPPWAALWLAARAVGGRGAVVVGL